MYKIIFPIAVAIILFATACSSTKNSVTHTQSSGKYKSVISGAAWLDTDGKPIQAHGFSVFFKDGTYYWYGENKEYTTVGSNVWTYGIRCYTSKDFYNWEDKGLIISPDTTDALSPLHPSQQIDRPHIIYCAKTGKYLAWIKIMGDKQSMTVFQADSFLGPYKLVHKPFLPNGFESGDFDLYVDEITGKGYLWAERPHYEMICSTLTEDFTAVTEEYSTHFSGIVPPYTREAPVQFMRDGKHYIFTSGTTGYWSNKSLVSTFNDYHGSYVDLGNPHPKDTSNTSYCSQITDVIKMPGKKDLYIALADRWLPKTCGTNTPKNVEEGMKKIFKDHKPKERSLDSVKLKDMRRVKRSSIDATKEATYVWLPITWENGVPKIYWKDEWRLEDYR